MDEQDRALLADLVARHGKSAVKAELARLPSTQRGRPKGARTVRPQFGLMRAVAERLEEGDSVHHAARRVVEETDWPQRAGMRGTPESQVRQVVKAWREFEPTLRAHTERVREIARFGRQVSAIANVRVPKVRPPSWVPHVKKIGRFYLHRRK